MMNIQPLRIKLENCDPNTQLLQRSYPERYAHILEMFYSHQYLLPHFKKKHLRMVGTISKYRRLVNTRKKQPERWKIAKHNKGSAKSIQLTVKRINKGNERNRPNWLPKIDKTETEKKTIPSNDEAHTHDLKRPHKKVRMDKPQKRKIRNTRKKKTVHQCPKIKQTQMITKYNKHNKLRKNKSSKWQQIPSIGKEINQPNWYQELC